MRCRPSFPLARPVIDTRARESLARPGWVALCSTHLMIRYGALANWTIAYIPAAGREVLANRARQQAAQTADAAHRDTLPAFANAIEP